MNEKWQIRQPVPAAVQDIQRGGVTRLCAEVLSARGIQNLEEAAELLDISALSDPAELRDIEKAASCITGAIEKQEKICVYGDYDCDGVTSTVMLYEWLLCAGANVMWHIPTREEGYGMNCDRIRKLHEEGVSLIVTVDNGISAIAEAKLIKELGMRLVVTDHHRPGDVLPEAVAVVDPYRADCLSRYKTICGAVVALKLIAVLDGGDMEPVMEQFGDLAALATIGDVMPLSGENRYLVKYGLSILRNTERIGLRALLEAGGIQTEKPIKASSAAFQLVPRINAAGRMETASIAAQLLLSEDEAEAQELAAHINELNDKRRAIEKEIMEQVYDEIRKNPKMLCERVLVFAGENWHHGVVGLAAAKLVERFGKPVFLMSLAPDGYRGSARGVDGFSIFEALKSCDALLVRYGGHPGAGGFTVLPENREAFAAQLAEYAAQRHPEMPVPVVQADKAVQISELTCDNVAGLGKLEPCGTGNPQPLFALLGVQVAAVDSLSEGKHTKFRITQGNARTELLLWNVSPLETGIRAGDIMDFLVTADVGEYRGKSQLSLIVRGWRRSERMQLQQLAAQAAYDSYRRGEPLPGEAYYKRMCPQRSDLIAVYRLVPDDRPVTAERLCDALQGIGMNLCRLRICADIFDELGLIRYDAAANTLLRLPVTGKLDLMQSRCYRNILELAGVK